MSGRRCYGLYSISIQSFRGLFSPCDEACKCGDNPEMALIGSNLTNL